MTCFRRLREPLICSICKTVFFDTHVYPIISDRQLQYILKHDKLYIHDQNLMIICAAFNDSTSLVHFPCKNINIDSALPYIIYHKNNIIIMKWLKLGKDIPYVMLDWDFWSFDMEGRLSIVDNARLRRTTLLQVNLFIKNIDETIAYGILIEHEDIKIDNVAKALCWARKNLKNKYIVQILDNLEKKGLDVHIDVTIRNNDFYTIGSLLTTLERDIIFGTNQ